MYRVLRYLLFCLPAETSHTLGLAALTLLYRSGLIRLFRARAEGPAQTLFGLTFPNPVGLAAGLDKNGDHIDALGALGFGFIEVGTVTPRPQPGNPRPRLFRLQRDQAIINRMGFNNKGLAHMVERLRTRRYKGVVGVNIGKNRDTPVDRALDDYRSCLEAVYPHADYVVVNLSSPNTPGLRELQFGDHLHALLSGLNGSRIALANESGRRVPLLVKIAPDMEEADIEHVAKALLAHEIDGVIATNTTVERPGLQDGRFADEAGGLSGRPLQPASTRVIRSLTRALQGRIPVIGVGGIHDAASAREKRAAGAALLQVYTGFIYAGPEVIDVAIKGYESGVGA